MGTIAGSPRPNGPIGYVTINGQRLPVEADPVWWRHWTEQFDGTRFIASGTIGTSVLKPGAATDVVSQDLALFSSVSLEHSPDGEAYRNEAIGITYTAANACTVVVTVASLYEVQNSADSDVSIVGGVYVQGDFAGGRDSVQTFDLLRTPGYTFKGSFSTSALFTMSAGQTKRFMFLPKYTATGGVTLLQLTNMNMRLEAVKV
jgi:hypothetical protein